MNLKEEFIKWFFDNVNGRYSALKEYTVRDDMEQSNKFFERDIFQVDETNYRDMVGYLREELYKKGTEFDVYSKGESNHRPRAILGKENYIKFLDEKFDSNQAKDLRYWIFQCNPNIYDLKNALKNNAVKMWTVAAHKDKIKPGDKVIIWQTGSEAGCLALGEVLTEPAFIEESVEEKKFYYGKEESPEGIRVKMKILYDFIDQPVLWQEIKDLPEFKNFKAGNQGTNFSATKEEFEIIEEIGAARDKSFYQEVKRILSPEMVESFLSILRNYLVKHNIGPKDERISFNVRPKRKRLVFIIGNRYALLIQKKNKETELSFISPDILSANYGKFANYKGETEMYWNKVNDLSGFEASIEKGFTIELNRKNKTPYRKYSDQEFINDIYNSNDNMKKIYLNGNSVYKLSMGKFLKDGKYVEHQLVKYFEENSLGVMNGDAQKKQGKIFQEELKPNDLVYITYGQKKLGNLCKVVGDPEELSNEINEKIGDTNHLSRRLEVIATPLIDNTHSLNWDRRDWLPSGNSTLFRIPDLEEANELLFNPFYGVTITNGEGKAIKHSKSTSMASLNTILYGPPGTGKTYYSKELAVRIGNPDFSTGESSEAEKRNKINEEYQRLFDLGQIVFTTFHQSFSYEDFVEGIKPISPELEGGSISYAVQDGIFKNLCTRAKTPNQQSFHSAYESLVKDLGTSEKIQEIKTPTGKDFGISLNSQNNLNLHTGVERKKQGTLTKENILKEIVGEDRYPYWEGYFQGVIDHLKRDYHFQNGESAISKNYVLVIDEINRGNISSIFGELITLLEEDKRIGNEEQIKIELPYSKVSFGVPNNLYIIGTMNTADRSVEALDTALRRRFTFKEVMPEPGLLRNIKFEGFNLEELLITLNYRIEALLDRDHTIGHSYFMSIESGNKEALKQVFDNKIIPLLQEYFYHDYEKIALILGDGFVEMKEEKVKFANFKNLEPPEFIASYELKKGIVEIETAVRKLLNRKDEEAE